MNSQSKLLQTQTDPSVGIDPTRHKAAARKEIGGSPLCETLSYRYVAGYQESALLESSRPATKVCSALDSG